jgi:hypothetical protein
LARRDPICYLLNNLFNANIIRIFCQAHYEETKSFLPFFEVFRRIFHLYVTFFLRFLLIELYIKLVDFVAKLFSTFQHSFATFLLPWMCHQFVLLEIIHFLFYFLPFKEKIDVIRLQGRNTFLIKKKRY